MLPAQDKAPVEVVDIDSSDDENSGVTAAESDGRGTSSNSGKEASMVIVKPKVEVQLENNPPPTDNYQPLECRSFWKAGAFQIGASTSNSLQGDLEHARVHPKFLHSNATSHKWAFGAIAELLDNAVDEIYNGATFVKVDRVYNKKDKSPTLVFQDDGGGMSPDGIRKCMSLGYSSKTSSTTIGRYGNGFKTSTMRLGADVIVFSRSSQSGQATQSVGLLSYTFLRRTGQDDVVVPMIDFDTSGNWADPIIYGSRDDWSSNLKTIIEWSPFSSKDELMQQFEDIGSHGTKVIIYNLWLNDEGIYELNFDDDDEDIMLRDEASAENMSKPTKKTLELQSHLSYRLRYSLRAYSSILYLKKFRNFKIVLRGKPVEQYSIADDLKNAKTFIYRPQLIGAQTEVSVPTVVGFIKEAPGLGISGFNVYHKNRLIRPYWKVTADGSSRGYGVVGVLEANFIEPAHDKQDFERSSMFIKLQARLTKMVQEFWVEFCHLIGYQPIGSKKSLDVQSNVTVPSLVTAAGMQRQSPAGKNANAPPVIDLSDEPDDVARRTKGSAQSNDQIADENIQLSRRCEEYAHKEIEMLSTIEELEKKLAETKAKSARLSVLVEAQRNLKYSSSNK